MSIASHIDLPWQIESVSLEDAEHAKGYLAAMVDATNDPQPALHVITEASGRCVAVTGMGPKSDVHAKLILALPALLEFWRAERVMVATIGAEDTTAEQETAAEKAYNAARDRTAQMMCDLSYWELLR